MRTYAEQDDDEQQLVNGTQDQLDRLYEMLPENTPPQIDIHLSLAHTSMILLRANNKLLRELAIRFDAWPETS